MRWLVGITVAALAGLVVYLGYGAWQTARSLETILAVGAPTVQGDGWPAPEGPSDIGFVGTPGEAFDVPFSTIDVETELGTAPAWLVPADPDVPGTDLWAIVVHGIGGRRENGYRFVPSFRDAGIPVMLVSYRNDEGAPRDGTYAFGLTEWRDLDAAVAVALERGASGVVLVGESMGGGIVGQFLERSDHAAAVRALVLDAAALDFPAVLSAQIGKEGVPLAPILARLGAWLYAMRNPVPIGEAVVTDVIAAFGGPVFVSHGSGDRIVPVSISDDVVASREGSTLYVRTGADHILSYKASPEAYRLALAAFLADVLGEQE